MDNDSLQICALFFGGLSAYAKMIMYTNAAPEEFYVKAHNMVEFIISKFVIKKEEVKNESD
jgi:hypothetical protein